MPAQELSTFVVQSAPPHVDGFNTGRGRRFYGIVITFADEKVFSDDAPERRQRQHDGVDITLIFRSHFEDETGLTDAYMQSERPVDFLGESESVFLQEIKNGNPALMINVRIAPNEALPVERDINDPMTIGHGP